jgi:hypothetical protein
VFILELDFKSDKQYISTIISAVAKASLIDVKLKQSRDSLYIMIDENDEQLEAYLQELEKALPASIYLSGSRHEITDKEPLIEEIVKNDLPQNLSLCPTCQKEMFDVSSRRYYYPFTSCNACGSHHAFLEHHPMKRANTTLKFLVPCDACSEEIKSNPLRKDFPLISCVECGIALKMVDKKSERYANDKGSYRTLFEVAARALAKGKQVLMQTTHGYRKFFVPKAGDDLKQSILMVTEVSALNQHLMMVTQEFNALLSIERPIVRVATKSDEMKALYGSSTWTKYPDDGMSMLLAKELLNAGVSYLSYVECDENMEADFLVDFDIPIKTQEDFRLFINQDTKLIQSGTRSIFPTLLPNDKNRIILANGKVSTSVEGVRIVDETDRFSKIMTSQAYILEGEGVSLSLEDIKKFSGFKASMLSVLAEHDVLDKSAIGVHFDSRLHFLYYNKKEIIDVVPPQAFERENLFEKLSSLRDGSDRLVENFKKKFPEVYARLDSLDAQEDIFSVAAIMIGLEEESFDGISAKALTFMGKGGLLIDTKVADNRFNDYAFLASLMSFKLSGVENSLLCYSIYESFGDYIADIVTQLSDKTKSSTLTLSGETFANQALWGRIQRNLAVRKPLLNQRYPIGKENVIYGAHYL